MAGVFKFEKKGAHYTTTRNVEEFNEIIDEIYNWWQPAITGDKVTIVCDLPV